jgi:dTMP kinase
MRGRFITFEGGEGTGKSTQVQRLARRLQSFGIDSLLTREPGGSPGAEAIRHVLLSGAAKPLGPDAEAMLFAAARDDHVRSVIRPALDAGQWVICDRFADSTRVYQGALGKVDQRLIRRLELIAVGDTKPDLTVILDLPAYIGLARAAQRRGAAATDRFESETIAFHDRLRTAYRALPTQEPERCVLIDARGDADRVADLVWDAVNERFRLEAAVPARPAEAMP